MFSKSSGDFAMLRMIVSELHVSKTTRQAVYYVISRLKHKKKTYYAMPKKMRRDLWETVKYIHQENFTMFLYVQGGR